MDFDQITSTTDRYNFHSHTQFCDGRATMAEFAQAAAEAGFRHYGFSPHSPVPIVSPCNMSMSNVAVFLNEVRRLKELYAGQTQLYASMEIDYLGSHWGPSERYFRTLPLDYRIGSVHFIPAPDGTLVDIDGRYASFKTKMEQYFRNDINYVVNTFFDQSEQMLRRGGFDIIGHLDKVAHNAAHYCEGIDHEPWFEQRVSRLIDMIAERGITVEVNTKAWAEHHRMFPDPKWFGRLKSLGIPVIINSDAHVPALIDASRDEALAMLRQ